MLSKSKILTAAEAADVRKILHGCWGLPIKAGWTLVVGIKIQKSEARSFAEAMLIDKTGKEQFNWNLHVYARDLGSDFLGAWRKLVAIVDDQSDYPVWY